MYYTIRETAHHLNMKVSHLKRWQLSGCPKPSGRFYKKYFHTDKDIVMIRAFVQAQGLLTPVKLVAEQLGVSPIYMRRNYPPLTRWGKRRYYNAEQLELIKMSRSNFAGTA